MKKSIESSNLPVLVSLLSLKIKVILVGGGTAAYIKCQTFIIKGCQVYILSENFIDEFDTVKDYKNVTFIKKKYDMRYIMDKHIVVIATNNKDINYTIKQHCIKLCKIYVYAEDWREGNCIIPCHRTTKNISLGVNVRGVSPKTSIFIANKLINHAKEYDDFVEFSAEVRNNILEMEHRKIIMNFMCTDDFYFFYKKGKADIILGMFYK